jgi:hypothetical protein
MFTKVMLITRLTERPNLMPRNLILTLLVFLALPAFGMAQEISSARLQPASTEMDAPESGMAVPIASPIAMPFETTSTRPAPVQHRFWDRENAFLFATSAAFSVADFVITRDNLRGGGQELNPVTKVFSGSTAGLAVNFAGENAGAMALSYVFHKTGHHRMERLVSAVNIGSSASAVAFDLAHR